MNVIRFGTNQAPAPVGTAQGPMRNPIQLPPLSFLATVCDTTKRGHVEDMTTTVSAIAATSATGPLAKTTIERSDVGPHDVAFDIKFAGICHSDIHTVKGEWGEPNYPVVAGHEIAGVVTEVGSEVTKYKVGDHVGVGCFVDSCRECDNCKAGLQQYCTGEGGMIGTYNATGKDGTPTYGGYSQAIVVDENYVLRIPDSIPLDKAAPLLCAGITLYSPAAPLEGRPRQEGRHRRARRLGPHGRQDRPRDGRRGDRAEPVAQEDGRRPAPGRRRVLRHQRPGHLHQAGEQVRPDRQHRVGESRPGRLPRPARDRRHAGRGGRARAADGGAVLPARRGSDAASPGR